MKSIYIVGIIILMGETECFFQDTTSIKILEEQRTLLRKLQNFQDPKDEKPLTWNEILADVLVSRIFSFHKVNENEIINEDSKPSKTSNIISKCLSQVLLIYKNCFFDKWRKKFEEPDFVIDATTTEDSTGVVINTSDLDGPKGEVEIIEPRYHGKQIDTGDDEVAVGAKTECPKGAVKDETGNCVNEHSRLLISVPSQCPLGYKRDRLGNCRMVFF